MLKYLYVKTVFAALCVFFVVACGWIQHVSAQSHSRVSGSLGPAEQEPEYEIAQPVDMAGSKPNIVFFLIDDLGYFDVGFTGGRFYETHNIDHLAGQGMVFERAYASGPNCSPTRASFLSGMTTARHRLYSLGKASKIAPHAAPLWVPIESWFFNSRGRSAPGITMDDYDSQYAEDGLRTFEVSAGLPDQIVSVAEILNLAGYVTGRFGKWHVGKSTQGFDVSSTDGSDAVETGAADTTKHYRNPNSAHSISDGVIEFIRNNSKKPFFVYVAHWEVHDPKIANPEIVRRFDRKLRNWEGETKDYDTTYAAMVHAADTSVGRILKALDNAGVSENTVVVFSSDNGGTGPSQILPLRSEKGSLYEGGIRVPTIVRWPAAIHPGTRSVATVSSVDWLPTFADLAGVDLANVNFPPTQILDGRSILPELAGRHSGSGEAFFHFPLYFGGATRPGGPRPGFRGWPSSALISGQWKLIEFFERNEEESGPETVSRFEFYNLDNDISESRNLAEHVESLAPDVRGRFESMRKRLSDWRAETDADVPTRKNKFFQGLPSNSNHAIGTR
ncbi:MAG: sulfatase [Gammaproteobacteria bacterium]|nr:sulfatase [Gammaproteobacteria bacterium]MYF66505.1 sulfatase [Gammaproteobacteria bacterium]MYK37183.1 sulfatase [Gammaproteobacteria bacterium]